jgi:hypothetical protein
MTEKTMTTTPRTVAEVNKRRSEIGAELHATSRIVPAANAKALEAEDAVLVIAYREADLREAEAARDAAEVARRIDAARLQQRTEASEARIAKAVEASWR